MEQVSLYRKYRPHNFENLVGQDHIKSTLINALKTEHTAHAYLFTGPRGTGKTSSARLIARALNCSNLTDGYEPCQECEFCQDITEGRLIDLIEIDAASNRGIDEVRDLREKINFAPSRSKSKVYIIDEVHMMTKEAFNALLKTLEEPPSHAYFILATTEIHKIPETIISRCQRFDFRRISKGDLLKRLRYIAKEEKIEVDDKALELIAKSVDGGLRDAIGLLEQLNIDNKILLEKVQEVLGVSSHNLLENMLDSLFKNDTQSALNIVHELHSQGSDIKQYIHEFVELLRERMLDSISKNNAQETARLIKTIEIFQEAQSKLYTSIPQLSLEIAIIRISSDLDSVAAAPRPLAEPSVKVPEPSKAPESEKAQQPEPQEPEWREPESVQAPQSLSLEALREKWPRITERIKTPALRMSLRSTLPIKAEGSNVSLQFDTNFHHDKVMENDHRSELEEKIKEFFNVAVKIDGNVKEVELKPVIEESPQEAPPVEESKIVDQALEIFGGELVD